MNGLYLDPPNYQRAVQQDLLPTVVRHLTPPAGPAPAGPPAHPPPLAAAAAAAVAAAPKHETEKPGSATICGVRGRVFWIMALVAVLLVLISVGGGLAARFVMENKAKNENIGTATALNQTAASPVGGVSKTQTSLVNSQLITIAVTTDGTTSWETSVTTIVVGASPTATAFSTITTKTSGTGPTTVTLPPYTSSSNSGGDPCADTLQFKSSVLWAGVSNTAVYPPQVLWLFDLPSGGSCCSQCWSLAPQKCNVWGYFPLGHPVDDKISCAIVYDYPGSQEDAMCPAGRPLVGILPGSTDAVGIAGNVGGTGPCAGPLYTQ